MVHGLEKFREYFGEHGNKYVFIGGTACDILMEELGTPFRATKDLGYLIIIFSNVSSLIFSFSSDQRYLKILERVTYSLCVITFDLAFEEVCLPKVEQ